MLISYAPKELDAKTWSQERLDAKIQEGLEAVRRGDVVSAKEAYAEFRVRK